MLDWVERVIAAGGDDPSQKTKDAINTFALGVENSGFFHKLLAVNCIAPDSLIAASVPLIYAKGNSVWTNVGHIDSELTVDGLKGISSDPPHRLQTGFVPSTDLDNSNSFGLTLYSSDADGINPPDNRSEFACFDGGGDPAAVLYTNLGGSATFDSFDSTLNRLTGVALANSLGYTSGNRTSANQSAIYVATGSIPHQSVAGPGNAVGATRPAFELALGCWNLGGNYQQGSPKRFSFCAIHLGLTEAESAQLFALVQAMRVAMGGGFVA